MAVSEPKASFVKKLPDITLAVQGTDIKLTVELSNPDVPVKWLRCVYIMSNHFQLHYNNIFL